MDKCVCVCVRDKMFSCVIFYLSRGPPAVLSAASAAIFVPPRRLCFLGPIASQGPSIWLLEMHLFLLRRHGRHASTSVLCWVSSACFCRRNSTCFWSWSAEQLSRSKWQLWAKAFTDTQSSGSTDAEKMPWQCQGNHFRRPQLSLKCSPRFSHLFPVLFNFSRGSWTWQTRQNFTMRCLTWADRCVVFYKTWHEWRIWRC